MRLARPTDLITVTRCGVTFHASRHTVAHVDFTLAAFRRLFPHARLTIMQPCYHKGVAASAGSHDYDAVIDFGFTGRLTTKGGINDWFIFQAFLRSHGWAAWFRDWTGDLHCHAISLPINLTSFATVVGYLIDGGVTLYGRIVSTSQLHAYLTRFDGLADGKPDRTWFPSPQPVFRYWRWVSRHGIPRNHSVA